MIKIGDFNLTDSAVKHIVEMALQSEQAIDIKAAKSVHAHERDIHEMGANFCLLPGNVIEIGKQCLGNDHCVVIPHKDADCQVIGNVHIHSRNIINRPKAESYPSEGDIAVILNTARRRNLKTIGCRVGVNNQVLEKMRCNIVKEIPDHEISVEEINPDTVYPIDAEYEWKDYDRYFERPVEVTLPANIVNEVKKGYPDFLKPRKKFSGKSARLLNWSDKLKRYV